jgi:hypothetical protein
VFARKKISLAETVDATKVKLKDDQAWDVLKHSREIIVGRGKNFNIFQTGEKNKDEILKHSLGRTGNLRAPTVQIGDKFIIGYNDTMYKKYVE